VLYEAHLLTERAPVIAGRTAWAPPPPRVVASDRDVHVWLASLDQPAPALRRLADTHSGDERARVERFRFERDKRRFTTGRGVLRMILGRYLDREPGLVRFRYGPAGKPALLDGPDGAALRFNVSHTGDLAIYAITRQHEIGVDVERIDAALGTQQIAAGFFSAQERQMLERLPPDQQVEGFFNCWTRKEAYLKARGDGLGRPLDQFSVSLAPHEPARLLHVEGEPREAGRWSLLHLTPASGYVAAIAVEGEGWGLHCWDWSGDPAMDPSTMP
jgi:4'-phosphopantetheinyl transferase